MKRVFILIVAAAICGAFMWPAAANAYLHHPGWHPHHPPPGAHPAPPPPGSPPAYKHRGPGWCQHNPKKCDPVVNTKKEACWDLNKDGFFDDYEQAELKVHPNACPTR